MTSNDKTTEDDGDESAETDEEVSAGNDESGTGARGILAGGAYAPRNRIPGSAIEDAWGRFQASGVEQKAVLDADEDALTMGVEAARRALEAGDVDASSLDRIAFASTTPPLAEEDLTPRLGSLVGAPESVERRSHSDSTRAGIDALLDAIDAPGTALVVVADCPSSEPDDPREHAAGAGAAAFLVGDDAPVTMRERASAGDPRPGTRFRRHGSDRLEGLDVGAYERAAFVEPIEAAVDGVETPDSADAIAMQAPDGALPYRTSVDGDAVAAVETVSELGDTAAASVPLSLARAWNDGHDSVLAVAWGSGAGATAVWFDGTAPVVVDLEVSTELDYPAYLRRRGEIVGSTPDGGAAHVPVPTWRRSLPQRHRLEAGACPDCGVISFPPEGACPSCHELVAFEPVDTTPTGEVRAVTTVGEGGAPPEFAEQQARQGAFPVSIVRFDAGDGTFDVPMQVVGDEVNGDRSDVSIGDSVEAVPRRIYVEEGVPRYGLKAASR